MSKRFLFTTLDKAIRRAEILAKGNPTLRFGQCLVNELDRDLPILAFELRNSPADPFYKARRDDCEPAIAWLWNRVG